MTLLRRRLSLSILILPSVLLAGLALSSASAPSDDGPIGAQMEEISGAMKRLRRALPDAEKRGECLELVGALQAAALEAKAGTPPMAETLAEAERPAFVSAYRKTMIELLQKSLELEVALLDGEQEAIDTAYKQLRAMEDTGHERFTDDG